MENTIPQNVISVVPDENVQIPFSPIQNHPNPFKIIIISTLMILMVLGVVGGIYIYGKNSDRKDIVNQKNKTNQPVTFQNATPSLLITPVFDQKNSIEMKGSSMSPNYLNGAYYTIDKNYYRTNLPQRGDVALVLLPSANGPIEVIKRIIGLPGETIQIKDGTVIINANVLSESYIPQGITTKLFDAGSIKERQTLNIPSNQYFVLGDNRDHSSDSRDKGLISKEGILGKIGTCVLNCSPPTSKNDENYIKGEVLVSFKENTTYRQAKDLFASVGITDYENAYWKATNKSVDDNTILQTIDLFKLKVGPGTEDEIVNKLAQNPIVRSASKNYVGHITSN